MKLSSRQWIIVSGITWFVMGSLLMIKGLKLVTGAVASPPPFLQTMTRLAGSTPQGALLIICKSLFLGFIKGRFVLRKAAHRVMARLKTFSSKTTLPQAYDRRYFILLASMMTLGLILRLIPIHPDIHGAIDIAIGCALINSSMLYFREALSKPLVGKNEDR